MIKKKNYCSIRGDYESCVHMIITVLPLVDLLTDRYCMYMLYISLFKMGKTHLKKKSGFYLYFARLLLSLFHIWCTLSRTRIDI